VAAGLLGPLMELSLSLSEAVSTQVVHQKCINPPISSCTALLIANLCHYPKTTIRA
jgi:hypothetical protein